MDVGSAPPGQAIAARAQRFERQQLQQQQQTVQRLAARDREVRAHEQAHASVGGAHASQPHYQFTKGPNGVRYAVAGHVNIDVSAVPGDPAATLKKMTTVARAALAPVQPSASDRAVAAKAKAQAAQARAELAAQAQVQDPAGPRLAGGEAGGYTPAAQAGSLIGVVV